MNGALLTQQVQVVRVDNSTDDVLGNATRVETSRSTVPGRLDRRVRLMSTDEATVGRDTTFERWELMLLPNVVIDAGDRVEWDGKVFEVNGSPSKVYSGFGADHIEASLYFTGPVT